MTAKPKFQTPNQRAALKPAHEPYWQAVGTGKAIGYRKPSTGNASWKARIRHAHQYHHASIDAVDYDDALRQAQLFFDTIVRGISRRLVTVGDAADQYGHAKPQAVAWHTRLIDHDPISKVQLSKLTRDHIRAWLRRHHAPTATLNRRKTALAAVLNHALEERAVQDGHAWQSLLKREQETGARQLVLTLEQRRQLINAVEHSELKALLQLLCLVPIRIGAAAALQVCDFDFASQRLHIRTDKAHAGRYVPCTAAMVELLQRQAKGRASNAPLFDLPPGRDRYIKTAVLKAGLPADATAYTLRHSIISELVMARVDLLTIAKTSGTSVKMIEDTYGHLVDGHVRAALDGLML